MTLAGRSRRSTTSSPIGDDLILLNPGDPKAITPAIRKAQAAGIVVVAVDTVADGADAAVTTDNVQAGRISCEYIAKKLAGKGNVIIENGPQVSAVTDRMIGCKEVLPSFRTSRFCPTTRMVKARATEASRSRRAI